MGGSNGGFAQVEEFLLIMGALLGSQFNFIYEKVYKYMSSLISASTKGLGFASLFIGIYNSSQSCQDMALVLMTVVHIITTGFTLALGTIVPPFGFMVATFVALMTDFILKPWIQNSIC